MIPMPQTNPRDAHFPRGCRLVSADGRSMPLRGSTIRAEAAGGLARVVLEQEFDNPHQEPLSLRYQLPLPADGSVSGFSFRVGDERIVGEVDRTARARQRFEDAVLHGHSAALLEQDRSSLFTQDIGNVPPGARLIAEVVIDQPLKWLREGQWEWRFPMVVAPRYQGGPGRVADHVRQMVDVAERPLPSRAMLALAIRDILAAGGAPSSQTHALTVEAEGHETTVRFRSAAGAPLDRDIAIRWPARDDAIATRLDLARPPAGHPGSEDAFGLLTVLPPEGSAPPLARDLVLLLDTSGSMSGQPLDQARRVAIALVESLTDDDSLEMVEFSIGARRWRREPCHATRENRRAAVAWLSSLSAQGGTEMHEGILAALEPLRDEAQRQVVLFTDGLIGFEQEVVGAIDQRLPRGCRVHCVGVGSAVNRSLTGPAARAGRGVESVVALGEDAERAAARLVAHTSAPLVVDLAITGDALRDHAPRALPDLFAGAPALVALRVAPEGGSLRLSGRTPEGSWTREITVPPTGRGEGSMAPVALYARERIEDLETELAAVPRRRAAIDAAIEKLGLDYQIASRRTSWIAVSDHATVDPLAPSRREVLPQELPFGMSVAGLGLRAPGGLARAAYGLAAPASRGAPAVRSRAWGSAPPGGGPPPPAAAPAPPPTPQPLMERDAHDEGAFDEADLAEPLEGMSAESEAPETAGGLERDKPKRRGLVGRLADGIRTAIGRPSEQRAQGRVLQRDGRRITLEITLAADTAWDVDRARLRFADGTHRVLTALPAATTRPGSVAAGMTVRLTLVVDDGERPLTASPQTVYVAIEGGVIVVDLLAPR